MSNWALLLEKTYPKYKTLVRALAMGPTIRPVMLHNKPKYMLELQEFWYDEEEKEYFRSANAGSAPLDERIEWATKELSKWQGVKRMAWDMWQFKTKKDAEKFITLYNLIWS